VKSIDRLQSVIDYQFNSEELLKTALTHRSYARTQNNETLEFLGDSILGLVISEHLYRRLGEATEGELSRMRASLVKESALARVARDIELGDYLYLGSGELKSGGFRRESILSDAMEALFGAIYLDAGFIQCRDTILYLYRDYLATLPAPGNLKDPKTALQEYLQGRGLDLPEYVVVKTEGKSHDQTFTVECRVHSLGMVTEGLGASRKKAEQSAASVAMKQASGDD